MTLEDAANTIVWWLSFLQIRIAPALYAKEIEACHIQITVQQMEPQVQRVFTIVPTEVADCYEAYEMEAA